MRRRPIQRAKRAAAAAMVELGVPVRAVAAELGISKSSVATIGHEPGIEASEVETIRNRLIGKMLRASDSFLDHSLDKIKDLGPYQAMLCSGIAFDKHLAGTLAARSGNGAGVLVQILTMIDNSTRIMAPEPTSSSNDEGSSGG